MHIAKHSDTPSTHALTFDIHRHAFSADSLLSLVYQIVRGSVPPLPPGRFSADLEGLIKHLLAHDPEQRPSLQEVCGFPRACHFAGICNYYFCMVLLHIL